MSQQGEVSLSTTLLAGSEEDFDVICDPCHTEGQLVQAIGHCLDCNENMCDSCIKAHKKMTILKDHAISDKSTLSPSQTSRATTIQNAEDKDPLADRCPKHPEELTNFYCNSHHALGCSVCITLDHRSCKEILTIRNVSGSVATSDELKEIQNDLQILVANLSSAKTRTLWIKQLLNGSYSQVLSDIHSLRRKIDEFLDQVENEMLEKASRMREEKTEVLDLVETTCEGLIGEAKDIVADIQEKMSKSYNNQLFISMKKARVRVSALAEEANHASDKCKWEHLSFQPNERITNFLSSLVSMGTVSSVSKPADVKGVSQYDINIKSDTDTEDCTVGGMILLPDGHLALTDYKNKSVKLVDVTNRKVSEQVELEACPLDLTCTQGNEIAITLQGVRYIQVLSASPALSKHHAISVQGLYCGIQFIPDKFILLCRDPIMGVHICDISGTLLLQIETDYVGEKLFTEPSRIAVSPDHRILYVSDCEQHAVVSLTIDGKLMSKYTNDKLKGSMGITVDDDGFIYVCSHNENTVHLLSPCGYLVKILLKEKDGIRFPVAIAYSHGRLFISSNIPAAKYLNTVKAYRLENKKHSWRWGRPDRKLSTHME